jgi:hypothetical protein
MGMKDAEVDIASGRGLRAAVVRHQMALFVLLAYLISWSFVIPAKGGLISYGPMIAAFIVLPWSEVAAVSLASGNKCRAGVWAGSGGCSRRGYSLRVHLGAFMINIALGARIINTAHAASLPVYLSVTVLPLLLLGGQWEEPGWLGYAQRWYQNRFVKSVLKATVVVGIIRIIWHTPPLAYGTIPWYDYIFGTFALQIIFTWLYNGAGASVLIAMIAHLFSNVMTATINPSSALPTRNAIG